MLRKRFAVAAVCMMAASVLAACDDVQATTPVALTASPTTLALNEAQPGAVVSLTTTPSGGRLDWSVTASPDWLEVSPTSGTIDGEVVQVTVTAVDLANLAPGEIDGRIEFVSDGGAAGVDVVATVAERRSIDMAPAELEFAETQDSASFHIRNTGNVTITWSIPAPGAHLDVAPNGGSVEPGDSVLIVAVANRDGLPVGTYESTLMLESDAADATMELPVRISVPAVPKIAVPDTALRFTSSFTVDSFTIANPGTGTLTWSADAADAWLQLSPASGTVEPGGEAIVVVSLDGGALPAADSESSIAITSDADDGPIALSAIYWSWAGLPPGLNTLDHRVVDAEYNRAEDLLVTVSADPARLDIIEPHLGTVHSVDLSLPPTAVSIAPSGLFAAVGHDGFVTYVDLVARSVVEVYAVTTDALDVVLADSGYVYVFPREDQWESIRTIELATGTETTSTGMSIYAGTVARLHPSGEFMYGADRGLSPSDFEKYDIRGGTAQVLYDSPYHGDYEFGGDIWISDDGARLFARSGNVFHSSTVQAEDMLYAGSLDGVSFARWIEHSTAADRILAFESPDWGGTPATEMRVYDPDFLNLLGTEPLPRFVNPATAAEFDAHGQFIFVDASGEHVYALVKADPASGLAQDWALAIFATSDLP